jgi:ATP-dependent DNA helicase PIF1
MSKAARSGLSTVKRDWTDQPSSPEVFYPWEPTQRAAQPQPQARGPSTKAPLTGAEKRLRDIQEALAGHRFPQPPPLSNSSSQNKRGSPTDLPAMAPPEKRRRLPPDWDDSLSTPSLSAQSRSSNSRGGSVSSQTTVATPSESKSIAPVFLSQEQTRILKLVQNGDSLFYTGSAGRVAVFLVVATCYSFCRDWKIGSPAGDHQITTQEVSGCLGCCGHNGFHWCVLYALVFPILQTNA